MINEDITINTNGSATIYNNIDFQGHNVIFNGTLNKDGGTLSLSGGKLTINGDYKASATTLVGGGELIVNGNFDFNGGTTSIGGGLLKVRDELCQPYGIMRIDGGRLEVGGDYRITAGRQSMGDSYGSLQMTNENDYVLVGGSFVTQSYSVTGGSDDSNNKLSAGTLEIKGDFIQRRDSHSSSSMSNFAPSGTHKVILSGSRTQHITFQNYSYSHINNLELIRPRNVGYVFSPDPCWTGTITENTGHYADDELSIDDDGNIVTAPTSGTLGGFDIDHDSWSFSNSPKSFCEFDDNGNQKEYIISNSAYADVFGEEYVALASPNADGISPFSSMISDSWNGSCMGMSYTAALFDIGKLNWFDYCEGKYWNVNDYYQEIRTNANIAPFHSALYTTSGHDSRITRLIESYQIWQDSFAYHDIDVKGEYLKVIDENNPSDNKTEYTYEFVDNGKYINNLFDQIKKSDVPLEVGLYWAEGTSGVGHSVLAYAWEKEDWSKSSQDGWYKVYVYDPNYPHPNRDLENKSISTNARIHSSYSTEERYIELNPRENKWRYNNARINAGGSSNNIGCDENGNVIVREINRNIDGHVYILKDRPDMITISNPSQAPTAFNGRQSYNDSADGRITLGFTPDTVLNIRDSGNNILCTSVFGNIIKYDDLVTSHTSVGYFDEEDVYIPGNTYVTLPTADFTIEYLSGDDITVFGQDNIINFRFTDQATIDVDMDDNSVVIESNGDNGADVQISNLREEGGFTSVLTTGNMNDGSTVAIELTDDEVIKAEMTDSSGNSSMDVYTHNETSNDTVFVETLTDENEIDQQIVRPGELALSQARLYGTNLTLDGSIGVNYFMELDDEITANDQTYMHFELPNGSTSDVSINDAIVDTTTVPGKTLYVFKYKVAAKEMTDEITAQIVVPQGDNSAPEPTVFPDTPDTPATADGSNALRGRVYRYTVKQYADTVLENKNSREDFARAHDLVEAMLNYGAYAQDYFDHNTYDPATVDRLDMSGVTGEYLESYALVQPQGNDNVVFEGAKLKLISETTLKMYFSIRNVDPKNVRFTYNGEQLTVETVDDYYCVSILGIAANDLGNECNVAINDGTDEIIVVYSPMAYCYNAISRPTSPQRTEELKNLMRALVIYYEEAEKYFEMISIVN